MGNGIGSTEGARPIDKRVHVKVGGAAHFDGTSAGGGVNLEIEKNFPLKGSLYLKGTAGADIYTNTKGADLGVELRNSKHNITPIVGVEAQYRQSGIRNIIFDNTVEVNGEGYYNYCNRIDQYKSREHMLNANLKAGLEGTTNNGRFTAGGGVKLGGKIDLGDQNIEHYSRYTEINETYNITGAQTRAGEADILGELLKQKPPISIDTQSTIQNTLSEHLNVAAYAHAEYNLGKGFSLFANGELGNNVKEGTIGVRYTF